MKAVVYARESVDDTSRAPPISEQIERAKAYALEKGIEVVGVYADNGFSGGDWRRPQYNKLIADARFHKFNQVIVWSQDRIARDTRQFLNFYHELKQASVSVHSITEGPIDLETLGGSVQHTTLALAAEIFRKITSEKVKRVYSAKKLSAQKEGKPVEWGRHRGNYDVSKILQLRSEGHSLRDIANELGCSRQTILRLSQKSHTKIDSEQ